MSTLRVNNIEAKSVPASPTIDEKIKLTNSSGDVLVHIDGKTSGITTIGINTTAGNITFDANSNVVVTGIITATKFVGTIEPTNLNVSGDLTIPDKIIHSGDTNTTIRFPAADTITAETGGSERLRIDSSGIVYVGGVGASATAGTLFFNDTSAHASKIAQLNGSSSLTFHTGASQPERLRINSTGDLQFSTGSRTGNVNSICAANGHSLDFNGTEYLYFRTAASERLRINSTGNVYIGQTSGSEQLGVDGGSNAQTFSTNSTNSNGNMLQVKCSGTTKLFLGSAGSFITGNTGTTNQGIRAEGALLFAAGGHTERVRITSSGHLRPGANNTYDLGESGAAWRNLYVNDAHFSNEGHSNSVDGTWGSWTLQEGENDIFMINNRTGKKYAITMKEVE